MKKLMHPNVLRLYEVLDDPNVRIYYVCLYIYLCMTYAIT